MKFPFFIISLGITIISSAQFGSINGTILSEDIPLDKVSIILKGTKFGTTTNDSGNYIISEIPVGKYVLQIAAVGKNKIEKTIQIISNKKQLLNINLINSFHELNEVVVTGTLKEVIRSESPVPVEVYTPTYFKKNPTPNIYEALQNVNGVRPQLNCNVCNTGDIHINGLEGPYTMVLIDGMPIVSSLSTVYGLSGIPNSLVERIEIVKGPASSLYGSEAVGGLINIITKKTQTAALLSADIFSTTWLETNVDLSFKLNPSKKTSIFTGINIFNYDHIVDNNNDNFTDVTLQKRISFFQKWNFERKNNYVFSLAARYHYEDRWGGDIRWNKSFRGGDSIYGESIYTKRFELMGSYQLPFKEKLMLAFSYSNHDQDSRYGITTFIAQQRIAFFQLTWDKKINTHDLLAGIALRYTYYDDNTPATNNFITLQNQPQKTWLPGVFFQDELSITKNQKLLMGIRFDYNSIHGNIFTPRLAYKLSLNNNNILRLNAGTGFRVVNLFTEDHAALTGAREVVIKNELLPEKSYNINLNFLKKIYTTTGTYIGLDASIFYTYFTNRIIGNYDLDPNKIYYDNLQGFAESKGISANIDINFKNGIKLIAGCTYMDVSIVNNGIRSQQILTEKFTGTWAVSYKIKKTNFSVDYTGNIYSPMRLPLLSEFDPRKATSPWWSIQNIQLTYNGIRKVEIYGGIKNLLDWTPTKNNPFIISRSYDPFDKNVKFNSSGNVIITPENPYGLTFDPTYVYAPNQGLRFFIGARVNIK